MCAQPRQQVLQEIKALLQKAVSTQRPVLVLLKPVTQRLTEPKYSTVNYHLILVTSVTNDVVHGMHFNKEVDIPNVTIPLSNILAVYELGQFSQHYETDPDRYVVIKLNLKGVATYAFGVIQGAFIGPSGIMVHINLWLSDGNIHSTQVPQSVVLQVAPTID